MRLAILAEKPHMLKTCAPFLHTIYPDIDFSKVAVFYPIIGWYTGNRRFTIPHGLGLKDFPYVNETQYRAMTPYKARGTIGVEYLHPETKLEYHSEAVLDDALRNADQILALMEPHSRSFHPAARFVLDRLGHIPMEKILYPWTFSQTEKAIVESFCSARFASDFARPLFVEGEIRRYFDFNYLVNSLAVIGAAARTAGLYEGVPSKFGLQFLFDCRETGPLNDGQRWERMRTWTGTGRFNRRNYSGLGSEVSRGPIVEDLVHLGFLQRSGKTTTDLTDAGRRFLDFLHPDCCDPDMPFRISDWALMPEDEAKPRIDRYIRTFFGKQMRHLEQVA